MIINEDNYIKRLRVRDELALEYIIKNYGWLVKTIVKKYLYNMTNRHEECINDVFLGAWNNIERFDESKNSFKNWIAAISKYKAIDYKRRYTKELNQESLDSNNILNLLETKSNVEDSLDVLEPHLEDLLSSLSKQDRELFLSLFYKDISIDDVSNDTGLKKSVIYNRISRGKKKLRLLNNRLRGDRFEAE